MSTERPAAPGAPDGRAAPAAPRTRRQWVTLGLGAVLLAALCVLAAVWQWHRYTDREAQIDLVESNYAADAVPLGDLLAGPGATLAADDVWQPAEATGRYRPQDTVLLRNRPVGGRPGFHVLVPFTTQVDGERVVLVVDRGFVPLGEDASSPAAVPDPPSGEVTVTVTMRADEPPSDRGAPAGQVQAVSTAQVLAASPEGAGWADGATVGAYGQLRTEDPAPDAALGALPEPDTDPGSHLSYTVQWCVFALGALGGYLLLWRRETRPVTVTAGDLLAGEPGAPGGGGSRRRGRRRVDEDYEDALLDAAEASAADRAPAPARDARDTAQARDTSSA
ncbi:SURF1 family protein [Isoptericola sp. BMS4]|uniref:SURF1 family cytochrome oxidase biogenesis protein n=1 Tax=Isoptericola sp. BMS4 TaxID=2527875 RepID=UPI001421AFF6|nr:SURF1 family protein [Isoptericola sp. BMS4]